MSRQGTNVIGTVLVTTIVTAGVLVGGYIGFTRFLAPQAVAPTQEAPAEEAAPRRRAPRVRKPADAAPQDQASLTESASADAVDVEGESAGESLGLDDGGAQADPEPANPAENAAAEATTAPAASEHPGDARSIMEESQRRSEARFYNYDGLLQSFDAKGKATEKRWTFDRVGSNGRSKAVLRFTAPAEVKGVALLIFNHPDRASDQWMWTPAIERDRRIALQDRSTRFFGTDFSFEDLEERDVDQYDYEMVGDDTIEGAAAWKIQTTPKKSRASHYTHSIAWIRKDNYVMARLDNYVKDEVVKRMTATSIEDVQGIWTARLIEMADLNRGTKTRLTLQAVKYNAPVKESDFTLEAIRH